MAIKKIQRMYILSFIFALHIALSAYVNSSFLEPIMGERYVGLLYTASSILTLLAFSRASGMLNRLGNKRFTIVLLILNMTALTLMIASTIPAVIGAAFVVFLTTNTLTFFCLDIFIEHFGDTKTIGRTRGLYLTVLNMAWMLSPLITGFFVTEEGGYVSLYVLAFAMVALTIIGMFASIREYTDKTYIKTPFLATYRHLKENRHMMAITIINFILQFFFIWMVIYTPIYLHEHIGLNWSQLGIIFTIMLSPFVLFGIPIGRLIDIYHFKKRRLLTIGILITSAATMCIAFTTTHNIWTWAVILFFTRVGAAMIETVAEIYFFTHVQEEDTYLLSVFRDMTPVSYLIAPVIATLFLSFIPFNFLFLALGIIILAGLYYVRKLKHNHELRIPDQNQ